MSFAAVERTVVLPWLLPSVLPAHIWRRGQPYVSGQQGAVMLKVDLQKVLFRDGDTVLGTHTC